MILKVRQIMIGQGLLEHSLLVMAYATSYLDSWCYLIVRNSWDCRAGSVLKRNKRNKKKKRRRNHVGMRITRLLIEKKK
jgi:hypothetical protein